MSDETGTSRREIAEVKAAIKVKAKSKTVMICPVRPNELKPVGNATKNVVRIELSSTITGFITSEKLATIGKVTIPARIATAVSITEIIRASFGS